MAEVKYGLTEADVAFLRQLKRLMNQGGGAGGLQLAGKFPLFATDIPIKVKNTTEEEIPPFSCLKFDGYQNDEGREAIRVTKPDDGLAQMYLCSGRFPIPVGSELGRAFFGVPCFGAFDTGTPAEGESWGPEPDSWKWHANRPGAFVIGEQDSTTIRIVPWLITGGYAKADGTITAGSTGTISVWHGNFAGDTTVNITGAYNAADSIDVASGDKLSFEFKNGKAGFVKLC